MVGDVSYPASAHLFPHQPTSPRFPVMMPVLTPVNYNPLYVDHSQSVRSGGDHPLCSPALAGVAVEQEQPIDLSVQARTCSKDRATPLDLTKKRPADGPQSGWANLCFVLYIPLRRVAIELHRPSFKNKVRQAWLC
jgi:hypothetical protein